MKEKCVFDDLLDFNITENFTVDFMHDVCEGVASCDLSKMLHYFIQKKVIALKELNNRIKSFDYGTIDSKNRPQ